MEGDGRPTRVERLAVTEGAAEAGDDPAALARGRLVAGRYRILEPLGSGAMGHVYRAQDIELDREIALKTLRVVTADAQAWLRREVRLASRISHPNVIRLHDLTSAEELVFVTMELVRGSSLRALLAAGPVALGTACEIARQCALGLGAAHAAGVVHRDFKPENVLIEESGRVVIVDFGVAGEDARRTHASAVVGTAAYMAPEQAEGRGASPRGDVYALGLVLYELLVGTVPLSGAGVIATAVRRTGEDAPPLRRDRPDAPAALEALVAGLLARDVEARPAELAAVARELETWAAPLGPWITPLPATGPASGGASAKLGARRWRWLGVALGAAAAVALALGGLVLTRRPAPGRATPLAAPSSVLACPQLEAEGVTAPTGWLGAAASALACERTKWMLGGRLERTLVPAELLGLPRQPSDHFPGDPYDQPDASARERAAARAGAQAILGGQVLRQGGRFALELTLTRPDGSRFGRGQGSATSLRESVTQAVDALVRQGAVPRAQRLDPEVSRAFLITQVDTGLAADEQNWEHSQHTCDLLHAQRGDLATFEPMIAASCAAYFPGWSASVPKPALDRTTPFRLAASMFGLDAAAVPPSLAGELGRALAVEHSVPARSVLNQALGVLYVDQGNLEAAHQAGLAALDANPRDPTSWWLVQAVVGDDLSQGVRENTSRAQAAWMPYWPMAWANLGWPSADPPAARLAATRRAYQLDPQPDYAAGLGDQLVRQGEPEEARGIAAALAGDADSRQARELILAEVAMSEGKLGAGTERLRALALARPPDRMGATDALVVMVLLRAGEVQGRARTLADEWVTRFVPPDGPDRAALARSQEAFVFMCLHASPASGLACFARLDLVATRDLALRPDLAAVEAGGRALFQGDPAGALARWRTLLGDSYGAVSAWLPVEVLDAAGELDLAEAIDDLLAREWRGFGGLSPAEPRLAQRAQRRGDLSRARELAQRVIAHWGQADVAVPAVGEMRALLAKLP